MNFHPLPEVTVLPNPEGWDMWDMAVRELDATPPTCSPAYADWVKRTAPKAPWLL